MEQKWSWWALKVMEDNLCLPFWLKKKQKKHSRHFWEDVKTRLGLKLKQLQRRQLERSSQTMWCLNTSHSHTTASKKLNKPVKGVFTFFQNTLSGCRDMCIKLSLCATVVYTVNSAALSLVTLPLSSVKSQLQLSFEHVVIMIISPCKCLIITIFIAGRDGRGGICGRLMKYKTGSKCKCGDVWHKVEEARRERWGEAAGSARMRWEKERRDGGDGARGGGVGGG